MFVSWVHINTVRSQSHSITTSQQSQAAAASIFTGYLLPTLGRSLIDATWQVGSPPQLASCTLFFDLSCKSSKLEHDPTSPPATANSWLMTCMSHTSETHKYLKCPVLVLTFSLLYRCQIRALQMWQSLRFKSKRTLIRLCCSICNLSFVLYSRLKGSTLESMEKCKGTRLCKFLSFLAWIFTKCTFVRWWILA